MSKLLTGALLGVAIGLLVAPEKGEDMREDLADTAENWKKKFNKLIGKAGMEMEDLRKVIEGEIGGLSDDVRSRLLTIMDEGKSKAQNMKSQAANAN